MDAYSLADAKAHLRDLVTRAEAGETVEITRDGRTVARLVPATVERTQIDFDSFADLRASVASGSMTVEDMRRQDVL